MLRPRPQCRGSEGKEQEQARETDERPARPVDPLGKNERRSGEGDASFDEQRRPLQRLQILPPFKQWECLSLS